MDEFRHRVNLLKGGTETNGPVIYWMSRDQRVHDNYALLFAQQIALQNDRPLGVVFNLVPDFLEATLRQYIFMLNGLMEIERELTVYGIPFFLLSGDTEKNLPGFIKQNNVSVIVTDFDPLKIKWKWKKSVGEKINIPIYEVDTHNIIPCRFVSNKLEFVAYTIRPKIHRYLPEFLVEIPELKQMKRSEIFNNTLTNWEKVYKNLKINSNVKEVDWIKPGERSAIEALRSFIENRFDNYAEERNDPVKDAQSNLSPYLHFGQISAQRIALEVKKYGGSPESEETFLEELIVRRELSDNFCFFNPHYDSFTGFPKWARDTLSKHRTDRREFVYTKEEFENSQTHEDLWNAAQNEMVRTGKMHGYMRMYWAKKILEWTNTPQYALNIAIYLNDKYELDGRDPNGYTGCAWSIGGVHDRPWTEREIFGKIRYMNRNGAKRKFDIESYIQKYNRTKCT